MADGPNEPATVNPKWRPWLQQFFDAHGAATREDTQRAAGEHLLHLARSSVATALRDVHATTPLRPEVDIDLLDGVIRISVVDGSYETPSMSRIDPAEALAEVADYLQTELLGRREVGGVWPVCGLHAVGLHAQARDGVAVWWCQLGNHAVAAVGSLGTSQPLGT